MDAKSANVLPSWEITLQTTQKALGRSSQLRTCSKTSFIHPHGLNVPLCFHGFLAALDSQRSSHLSAPCAPAPGCWTFPPASRGPNGLCAAQLICHCWICQLAHDGCAPALVGREGWHSPRMCNARLREGGKSCRCDTFPSPLPAGFQPISKGIAHRRLVVFRRSADAELIPNFRCFHAKFPCPLRNPHG